jgi:hypothetical protein
LYSTVASAETTTTKTNHVIAGDTQQYRIYEGLAPTMQLGKRHATIQCQAHLSGGTYKGNSAMAQKNKLFSK